MCCRYVILETLYELLENFPGLGFQDTRMYYGDVHPADPAPIIFGTGNRISPNASLQMKEMHWGFASKNQGGLLINARAESAMQKPSFRNSIQYHRCVIPASAFYEWDSQKEKVTFSWEKHPVMFMAGCFQPQEDGNHFVILTTEANNSMRPVHDRMPLILPPESVEDWIYDDQSTTSYLKTVPPELHLYRPYQQLSLF